MTSDYRFETFVRITSRYKVSANELGIPMHSRNHADSECVSYAGVDRKGAEFTDNKQIYSLIVMRVCAGPVTRTNYDIKCFIKL